MKVLIDFLKKGGSRTPLLQNIGIVLWGLSVLIAVPLISFLQSNILLVKVVAHLPHEVGKLVDEWQALKDKIKNRQ